MLLKCFEVVEGDDAMAILSMFSKPRHQYHLHVDLVRGSWPRLLVIHQRDLNLVKELVVGILCFGRRDHALDRPSLKNCPNG